MALRERQGVTAADLAGWDDEQRAVELLPADEQNAAYQAMALRRFGESYRPEDYSWAPPPASEPSCACYEWRRYPVGQRHFGFVNWLTCDGACGTGACGCACHVDQIWLA